MILIHIFTDSCFQFLLIFYNRLAFFTCIDNFLEQLSNSCDMQNYILRYLNIYFGKYSGNIFLEQYLATVYL